MLSRLWRTRVIPPIDAEFGKGPFWTKLPSSAIILCQCFSTNFFRIIEIFKKSYFDTQWMNRNSENWCGSFSAIA